MNHKKFLIIAFLAFSTFQIASFATIPKMDYPAVKKIRYPFYVGVSGGYGSTTWGFLVPPEVNNNALYTSTPINVTEGGAIWGLFTGYELNPYFAIDASYTHYPTAKVNFHSRSLFTFVNNELLGFSTNTESLAVVGKFMVFIWNTPVRAFSIVGAAGVHREDIVVNRWQVRPKFGLGANYNLTDRIMFEIGLDYTAGDAVTEVNPAESFVPFLYSGYFRLALCL